jgi:CRP-like cAMP-binding protein
MHEKLKGATMSNVSRPFSPLSQQFATDGQAMAHDREIQSRWPGPNHARTAIGGLWTSWVEQASLVLRHWFQGATRVSSTIFEQLFVSQNIVHVAALLFLLGFLFRDQFIMRGLILLGDLLYILYFYFAPEEPLWGGIFWSALFAIANVVMIWLIFFDEVQFSLRADERKLFDLLGDLTPGQFRKLLKAGRQEVAIAPLVITRENEPSNALYFVVDGQVTIGKGGHLMVSEAKTFIGEIAFLLSRPATATVTLETGCHYCVWDSKALHSVLNSNPALRTALSAINRLAEKVAKPGVLTDITGDDLKVRARASGLHGKSRLALRQTRDALHLMGDRTAVSMGRLLQGGRGAERRRGLGPPLGAAAFHDLFAELHAQLALGIQAMVQRRAWLRHQGAAKTGTANPWAAEIPPWPRPAICRARCSSGVRSGAGEKSRPA